jgi:hypothetical protein
MTTSLWVLHRRLSSIIKGNTKTGHQGLRGGVEVQLPSFSTSELGGCGWLAPRPGRFTPGKPGTLEYQGGGG